jgi:hypothetical protein
MSESSELTAMTGSKRRAGLPSASSPEAQGARRAAESSPISTACRLAPPDLAALVGSDRESELAAFSKIVSPAH